MNKFAIIGDSTCDLPRELREQYDIDYCYMSIVYKEGKEDKQILADLDWKDIPALRYYQMMRDGTRFITAQVTEDEFKRVIGGYLEKGMDVLYISCSSALSQSVNLARRINDEEWSKKYPSNKVIIVDSLISVMGQGSMLINASKMREEGMSIDEVAKKIEETKLNYHQIAVCDSLTYLARAGRIKGPKAFFGNLAGVKPILISDKNGNNLAVEKVKGRRHSLERIIELTKENVIDPEAQTAYLSHADAKDEEVEFLKDKLLNECRFKDVYVNYLGPIISATTGPGTIGIFFTGKEVTAGENK